LLQVEIGKDRGIKLVFEDEAGWSIEWQIFKNAFMICWGSTLHRGESEIPSPESKWGDYHPKPDEVAPFDWAEPAAETTFGSLVCDVVRPFV